MSEFVILRREIAANAINAIRSLYSNRIADIQAVKDGDGATLKTIHWGATTPRFYPQNVGYLPQWTHQEITLELRASVDYGDRTLDARYLALLEVFEDFFARPDLHAALSSSRVVVQSPPVSEEGEEMIDNGRYVTAYRLRVSARGVATGG